MKPLMSFLKELSIKHETPLYFVGAPLVRWLSSRDDHTLEFVGGEGLDALVKDFMAVKKEAHPLEKLSDGAYQTIDDGRVIIFRKDQDHGIETYLKASDFILEALAVDVKWLDNLETFNRDKIIDPLQGMEDLENQTVRAVDIKRLSQRPLLMLKAIRLMAELNFQLDETLVTAIYDNRQLLQLESGQKLGEEIFRLLKCNTSHKYLKYMNETLDILSVLFPEIHEMKEVGECKYHVVDVFKHSLYVLELLEEVICSEGYFEEHVKIAYEEHTRAFITQGRRRMELIKLAAFFHDVGKPSARKIDETGRTRFRGHEITGAEIIRNIGDRLGLTVREKDILYRIIAKHMLPLVAYKTNDVSGKALYKIFSKCKEETLDILLIGLVDIVATRVLLDPEEEMGKFKVHIEYMANNYLTRYKTIQDISHIIKGKDILEAFDLEEDTLVSDLIKEVRKAIYFGKIPPRKEAALKYVEKLL